MTLTTARRIPFRLKTEQTQKKIEQSLPTVQLTEHTPPTPPSSESVPQDIIEEEELERLAGLQIRDRLIRGLDLPNVISSMLASPQSPPPLLTSLLAPPPAPSSPPHTLLPHRRHTSSSSFTHQYIPLLSMSAGRHRLPVHKSRQDLTIIITQSIYYNHLLRNSTAILCHCGVDSYHYQGHLLLRHLDY